MNSSEKWSEVWCVSSDPIAQTERWLVPHYTTLQYSAVYSVYSAGAQEEVYKTAPPPGYMRLHEAQEKIYKTTHLQTTWL